MVKLVALYKHPENRLEFDKHYSEVHMPLTKKMPGLQDVKLTYFKETPMGTEAPYYLQTDLYFSDQQILKESMSSPEGIAAAKDLMKFAGKLVTMMISEEDVS